MVRMLMPNGMYVLFPLKLVLQVHSHIISCYWIYIISYVSWGNKHRIISSEL